jgi:hypothetical protein
MDEYRPTRRQILAAGGASFAASFTRWATAAGAATDPTPTDPADLTLVEILPLLDARRLSLAGAAVPVTDEGDGEPPLLEEEPALWPDAT